MVKTKHSKDSKARKTIGKKSPSVKRTTANKTQSSSEVVSSSRKRKSGPGPTKADDPTEQPPATSSSTPKSHGVTAQPETTSDQSPSDPMIVTIDRRRLPDRRSGTDRRQQNIPVPVERRQLERRAKVPRRRQIDPTTCERDYTPEEIEFMRALDEYKRASGRMFPTCSEILEVLKKLGYEKRPQPPVQPTRASEGSPEEPDTPSALSATAPIATVASSAGDGGGAMEDDSKMPTCSKSPEEPSTCVEGNADVTSPQSPTQN